MNKKLIAWGLLGVSPLFAALACSGKNVVESVGDLNSAGKGGSAGRGGASGGGGSDERTDPIERGGSAGVADTGGAGVIGGFAGMPDPIVTPDAGAGGVVNPQGGGGGVGGGLVIPSDAGAGGEGVVPFECPTCTLVADDQDVRSVTTSASKVYWVDYGKYDHLGNYDHNGRLFARDLSGGVQTLIADGLPGPEEVSVSGDYAYVWVDGRTQPNFPQGLLRIALSGGTPVELSTSSVNDYVLPRLSAAPGYEYWVLNAGIVRAANADDAKKETVLAPRGVEQITNDGETLFFRDHDGVWAKPLAGGDAVQLYAYPDTARPDNYNLVVAGSYLYAFERPDTHTTVGFYLIRMPKTGGSWTRLVATEPTWSRLAVDGNRVFIGAYPSTGDRFSLLQTTLSALETQTLLLNYQSATHTWPWVVASGGVFYGNDHALYFTPWAP